MEKTILEKCLTAFNMSLSDFAKFSKINYQTLNGWDKNKKVSPLGTITLELILERKETKEELNDFRELKAIHKRFKN